MNAERERLEPANRSILSKTSLDSVIDVFSFILPLYHYESLVLFRVAGKPHFSWGHIGDTLIRFLLFQELNPVRPSPSSLFQY